MKNKKKRILEFLKNNGRSSTSKIANEIKSNKWMAEQYLKSLEHENKITREEETNAVYWTLN